MPKLHCPSCNTETRDTFKFCPACGFHLKGPVTCPACKFENGAGSIFCARCGTELSASATSAPLQTASGQIEHALDIDVPIPTPGDGITIEFPHSTAQTFELAVTCARRLTGFQQYGNGKDAVFRVSFDPSKLESALELNELLKGWRRRAVYIDGAKTTWESVFSFAWCYERKKSSFKPELYCFGYGTCQRL